MAPDVKLCYSCENYVLKTECILITIQDTKRFICHECCEAIISKAFDSTLNPIQNSID